jgi:multidrug efflux pump
VRSGAAHSPALPLRTFNLKEGATLAAASRAVERAVADMHLPDTLHAEFMGDARDFARTSGSQGLLIVTALLAVYIILGVLYESLVHPLTIISTLPSAGLGALFALQLAGMELTIIAFIGIILLIGIVKKNGIMLVDFAIAAERDEGKPPEIAIYEACLERFRPILMTTMAALLGAVPLALATGAGSELRRPLGITIVGGLGNTCWGGVVTRSNFHRRCLSQPCAKTPEPAAAPGLACWAKLPLTTGYPC